MPTDSQNPGALAGHSGAVRTAHRRHPHDRHPPGVERLSRLSARHRHDLRARSRRLADQFRCECTGGFTSLTKQRREVLSHPERLESLGRDQGSSPVERIPSPKNRSNNEASIKTSITYEHLYGPQRSAPAEPLVIENTGPPDIEKTALAS